MQFRHFLVELHRYTVANVEDENIFQGLMSKPSEPTKSFSFSHCPVCPTNALFFNF